MIKKTTDLSGILSKYSMLLVLAVLLLTFGLISDRFLTVVNFGNMFLTKMASAFLALAGMFIIISGEFDLSIGFNLTFAMVISAYLENQGVNGVLVVLVPILCGIIAGLINGLIVVNMKISSFIVTLSVGMTLSGMAQAITNSGNINISSPAWLLSFTRNGIGNVGYCVIFWIVAAIILHLIMTQTPIGRQMYAVGTSEKIAFMAGIKTSHVRVIAFTCAGFFASIGGLILLGQLGSASSAYGTSLLLPAYATVFLSKAVFKPGYINVPGVVLSVVLITVGVNGIQMVGAPTWSENIFSGIILMFSMWLSQKVSPVEIH